MADGGSNRGVATPWRWVAALLALSVLVWAASEIVAERAAHDVPGTAVGSLNLPPPP